MSIPHFDEIRYALLRWIGEQPDGTVCCADVFEPLSRQFPELTTEDTLSPWRGSETHWVNRVRWVRQDLVNDAMLLKAEHAGPGNWKLSPFGREVLNNQIPYVAVANGRVRMPRLGRARRPVSRDPEHSRFFEDTGIAWAVRAGLFQVYVNAAGDEMIRLAENS
jgi:hypothetical protein